MEKAHTEYSKRVVFIATVFDKLVDWGMPPDLIKLIEFPLAMPDVSERFLPDTRSVAIKNPVIPQSTMDMPIVKTQKENNMRKKLLQTRLNKLIKSSTPMPVAVPVQTQLSQLMHVPVKSDTEFRNVSGGTKKLEEPSFWSRLHTEFQTTQKMRQLAAENVMGRQGVKQVNHFITYIVLIFFPSLNLEVFYYIL